MVMWPKVVPMTVEARDRVLAQLLGHGSDVAAVAGL